MKGILIDPNTGDLLIEGGGMQLGDVRLQCAERVLRAMPGEFKHAPMLGGAVRLNINGRPDPFWHIDAKRMLQAALIEVERVHSSADGTIKIFIKD